MKRDKKKQLDSEQLNLFDFLWLTLEKEYQKILDDFGLARNMACSEFGFEPITNRLAAVKMLPESMTVLHENFNKLVEHNSRQKYFLIQAYLPTLKRRKRKLNSEQLAVYTYWEEELKKHDPELENRFRKPTGA